MTTMYAPFKLEREYIDRFSDIGINYEPLMDGEYSHDDIIEYLDWEEREKERQIPESVSYTHLKLPTKA